MKKHSFFLVCCALWLAGCGKSDGGPAAPAVSVEEGKKVYTAFCAACHQADGSGMPNMQPALTNNAVVKGDPRTLAGLLLFGPDKVLPAERARFSMNMPPYGGALSDEQAANVLSYLRKEYGGGASAIDANQVKEVRANPPKAK